MRGWSATAPSLAVCRTELVWCWTWSWRYTVACTSGTRRLPPTSDSHRLMGRAAPCKQNVRRAAFRACGLSHRLSIGQLRLSRPLGTEARGPRPHGVDEDEGQEEMEIKVEDEITKSKSKNEWWVCGISGALRSQVMQSSGFY